MLYSRRGSDQFPALSSAPKPFEVAHDLATRHVLLDLNLPDLHGFDVCQRLPPTRQRHRSGRHHQRHGLRQSPPPPPPRLPRNRRLRDRNTPHAVHPIALLRRRVTASKRSSRRGLVALQASWSRDLRSRPRREAVARFERGISRASPAAAAIQRLVVLLAGDVRHSTACEQLTTRGEAPLVIVRRPGRRGGCANLRSS